MLSYSPNSSTRSGLELEESTPPNQSVRSGFALGVDVAAASSASILELRLEGVLTGEASAIVVVLISTSARRQGRSSWLAAASQDRIREYEVDAFHETTSDHPTACTFFFYPNHLPSLADRDTDMAVNWIGGKRYVRVFSP